MNHLKTFEQYNHEMNEGLGDFFRGGTKEEIEAKKKGIESKLTSLESTFSKFKKVLFKDKGIMDKFEVYSKESALKYAAKNNYLGVIRSIEKGDTLYIIYEPGKKGLSKLAAGSGSMTTGE